MAKTACCAGGLPHPTLLLQAESWPTSRFFFFNFFFKLFN
jgi:hypothetical protein